MNCSCPAWRRDPWWPKMTGLCALDCASFLRGRGGFSPPHGTRKSALNRPVLKRLAGKRAQPFGVILHNSSRRD
jgi:hypothetical protein